MKLAEGVERYVQRKRADGLIYDKSTSNLKGFCRQSGNPPLECIKTHHVLTFLNGPRTSTVTWRRKYNLLKSFFDFWVSRGEMPGLQMPPPRPPVRQTFVPHIYSREEIRRLLGMVRHYPTQFLCTIDPQTMSTLLLILYGTGALIGEMRHLLSQDVDLKTGFITIRSNRFNRTRRIPIGSDLRGILQRYSNWKCRKKLNGSHFFVNKEGRPLTARTVGHHFQRIRGRAGVVRRDGATYQPRMHDLRFTFAVHRITSWIKNGADLNRMLPALSAYMGQAGLASTERFLFLTPERFRKELDKLSPQRAKKHWRDSSTLMKFLEEL